MAALREEHGASGPKMFSLKKWNAVAMWSWDVECDTCAICRVQVMDACLRCQAENKQEDCVGMLITDWISKPGERVHGYLVWCGENVTTPFIIAACPYG
ncbi:hypothetical protein XENTR_v10014829 [Xenopus tropicalis]|nr:hypothetical protein XENTR_v10014829 [Xenopus tropicalis]